MNQDIPPDKPTTDPRRSSRQGPLSLDRQPSQRYPRRKPLTPGLASDQAPPDAYSENIFPAETVTSISIQNKTVLPRQSASSVGKLATTARTHNGLIAAQHARPTDTTQDRCTAPCTPEMLTSPMNQHTTHSLKDKPHSPQLNPAKCLLLRHQNFPAYINQQPTPHQTSPTTSNTTSYAKVASPTNQTPTIPSPRQIQDYIDKRIAAHIDRLEKYVEEKISQAINSITSFITATAINTTPPSRLDATTATINATAKKTNRKINVMPYGNNIDIIIKPILQKMQTVIGTAINTALAEGFNTIQCPPSHPDDPSHLPPSLT
ncbi:hypothetical protein ANN_03245 [Periplaneta americana]|uniref:Uncharacterized protein n=1 Tax=Periplaneta americana TaxID=6978 RepID=A0ABQ8U199_PERAM|nr:hypothetical protein ANN_03245 [Periplaneta americana]